MKVAKFEPRRREAPALFVELRLGDDFRIEVSLHDGTGVVGTLEYRLTVASPPGFDLDLLRAQWGPLARTAGGHGVIVSLAEAANDALFGALSVLMNGGSIEYFVGWGRPAGGVATVRPGRPN